MVGATVAEDIATAGLGLLNDAPSVAAAVLAREIVRNGNISMAAHYQGDSAVDLVDGDLFFDIQGNKFKLDGLWSGPSGELNDFVVPDSVLPINK